jgi:hypothetical protein
MFQQNISINGSISGSSISKFIPETGKESLFIPYIPRELFGQSLSVEECIAKILGSVGLFNIKRIDISKNKNGSIMAFVHFIDWVLTPSVINFREIIDVNGFYQFNINFSGGYIRFLYNKNPIPDVDPELNITQLADVMETAEKKIIIMTDNDLKQKTRIEELERLLEEKTQNELTLDKELSSHIKKCEYLRSELNLTNRSINDFLNAWKVKKEEFDKKESVLNTEIKGLKSHLHSIYASFTAPEN